MTEIGIINFGKKEKKEKKGIYLYVLFILRGIGMGCGLKCFNLKMVHEPNGLWTFKHK